MPEQLLTDLLLELQAVRVSLEGLRTTMISITQRDEDHESRLRIIERQQQMLSPFVSGLLFVLGGTLTALVAQWVG